ncbi:MAG: sigma-70 family RNA polymerase sigma factor [Ilumatobacteraceae bacterium]
MRRRTRPEEATALADFDQFFRLEYPRLVPMLHGVLGDRGRAEDIAQEALAAAQRDWPKVVGFDQPGAWVRRVALNQASNVRRRRGREVVALRRVGPGHTTSSGGDEPTDERLWQLVRDLPHQQRCCVALHYVEDRSVAEIAAILTCSEGTVKTHLSRARAALTRALGTSREEATS